MKTILSMEMKRGVEYTLVLLDNILFDLYSDALLCIVILYSLVEQSSIY